MSDKKADRRVERTRNALKISLVTLMNEMSYDAITIQEIADHANIGRTTFYLHYQSKDDLLLDHYAGLLDSLQIGEWSRDELLSKKEATGLITYLDLLAQHQKFYYVIIEAKHAEQIEQKMQQQLVDNLTNSLKIAFPDQTSRLPLDILCHYIAGAQLALIKWWMTTRTDYTSKHIAHMIQRLQYVAIADAFHIEGESNPPS